MYSSIDNYPHFILFISETICSIYPIFFKITTVKQFTTPVHLLYLDLINELVNFQQALWLEVQDSTTRQLSRLYKSLSFECASLFWNYRMLYTGLLNLTQTQMNSWRMYELDRTGLDRTGRWKDKKRDRLADRLVGGWMDGMIEWRSTSGQLRTIYEHCFTFSFKTTSIILVNNVMKQNATGNKLRWHTMANRQPVYRQ